ncbi:bifunctional helix-turn-helix transcriptional regulator/GNAT family N-acetyltransferase [Inquilinus limosus]|uniref:bifunctional helix-turn-helix transcriptional regulator/GNAT family N-acetyltransferase n=1 Tax=Inquilinus limosus TaxID=171674 RepID=UPI00041A8F80|nr:bifunctional helix-turn-helix transcriptional regulator/GNAT family N-acetyltransferase [Inquilinus limosus]
MAEAELAEHVTAMRHFNRFYTQKIGVLEEGLLQSPFSLTELRVLYELVHRDRPTASELGRALGLDAGYLSRILARFEQQGLLVRTPSPQDGRQSLLAATEAGRAAMAPLEERSNEVLGRLLQPLSAGDRAQLTDAFRTVERLLGEPRDKVVSYLLRPHRPGDLGWIVHRHGVLYAREYGWGEGFEALVAEIAAQFLRDHDPQREQCWVAELDGEMAGTVMLVRQSDETAKLRLLLVEPTARGHGIGARLVEECIRFARRAGYRRLTLWTNDVLAAARRIYEKAGFRLVDAKPHRDFGPEMVGETWELEL